MEISKWYFKKEQGRFAFSEWRWRWLMIDLLELIYESLDFSKSNKIYEVVLTYFSSCIYMFLRIWLQSVIINIWNSVIRWISKQFYSNLH